MCQQGAFAGARALLQGSFAGLFRSLERLFAPHLLAEVLALELVGGHDDGSGDIVLGLELAAGEEVLPQRVRLPRVSLACVSSC